MKICGDSLFNDSLCEFEESFMDYNFKPREFPQILPDLIGGPIPFYGEFTRTTQGLSPRFPSTSSGLHAFPI